MSDTDRPTGPSDDLSGEIPSPDVDQVGASAETAVPAAEAGAPLAEADDLEGELPSAEAQKAGVVLESATFRLGRSGFSSVTVPGSLVNRASGFGFVIMLATVAAYATAGVCKFGPTTGDVVTVIGLVSFVAVLVLGLIWITGQPATSAAPQSPNGRQH